MNNLAINGGKPVRSTMLPYGSQWIDDADIESVIDALKSDFITQGPAIQQFEKAVAEYVGARFAVAFSSGTAALHAACFAAEIGSGDEVITTPLTFAASSNCVLYSGGTPVFADIDANTYNIDPLEIKKKITPRTKAIIAVDYSGQPVDIDKIRRIAKENQLIIIQDAAHSLGATWDGKKVGALADMTMFSFHPVKHITTAEGGMIVTDNEFFYQRMQLFRSHGITKDPNFLLKNEGPWYYEMQELGFHYRITDLQAALGKSQLQRLNFFINRRREIAHSYLAAFNNMPGLKLPYQHPLAHSSWHLFILSFDLTHFSVDRKQIFEAFKSENIGVNVHYIPVYQHPYYQKLGYAADLCPKAEALYLGIISLPLFPRMSEKDVIDVIHAVNKIYQAYYKKP
jgi:perosamine synthetase